MVRKGLKKGGKITEEREEGLFKQNSSLYSNLPKEFPTRGMLLYSLHTSWSCVVIVTFGGEFACTET